MNWQELEHAAPELARQGRQRLDEARLALLATLRRDGSPRISPVESYLHAGELLFGAMAWSRKAHDLLRDPRCVLHSAVTRPDAGEGELKLYGRAVEADAAVRDGCAEGWWQAQPHDAATVFALDIGEATFVAWDLERARMRVWRWSATRGATESERTYP